MTGDPIRAGRAAKFGLFTLLLLSAPEVFPDEAGFVPESGERSPQKTALTGHTLIQGGLFHIQVNKAIWICSLTSGYPF